MTVDDGYVFVILVLATLLVTGIAVLVVSGYPVASVVSGRAAPRRLLRVREDAETLGIDPTIWGAALAVGPVAGVGLGVMWGLPPALVPVLVLLGACTLPWLASFRRDTLLQRREDAVVAMVKDMRDRLAGSALNQVVRNLGQRPPDLLAGAMAVLADIDRPIEDCLAACARRSGSALMNRFCVYVAVGLKADSTAFRELLPTTIIPHLEGLLTQQKARKKALAYQRGVITIMAGVLVALFSALYTMGPAFHDFYGTAAGAVTIAVLVAGFAVLVGLVHAVLRSHRRPAWDLEMLNTELAKY